MMRRLFILLLVMCLGSASAQNVRDLRVKTDSIDIVFQKQLKDSPFTKTELVSNPDNFFEDLGNEIIGDTIWLADYENFKFYRTKAKDGYMQAEYYNGKIGSLFECEKNVYYFKDNKLVMTKQLFYRHGDAIDEYGYNLYIEERRVVFLEGRDYPAYLMRDCEGTSDLLDINTAPFQQYDVRKIIYDKDIFETVGYKILNHNTDI